MIPKCGCECIFHPSTSTRLPSHVSLHYLVVFLREMGTYFWRVVVDAVACVRIHCTEKLTIHRTFVWNTSEVGFYNLHSWENLNVSADVALKNCLSKSCLREGAEFISKQEEKINCFKWKFEDRKRQLCYDWAKVVAEEWKIKANLGPPTLIEQKSSRKIWWRSFEKTTKHSFAQQNYFLVKQVISYNKYQINK